MVAYVCDEDLWARTNKSSQNYWDVYIREMCDQLGLRAAPLSLSDLENAARLAEVTTLIIGRVSGGALSDPAKRALEQWVKAGGILIGFGVPGLDALFGVESVGVLRQGQDEASIRAGFAFRPHSMTHQVHPIYYQEQKLLILSDVALVRRAESTELARLYDESGKDLAVPAITWNACGDGYAGYFAFDAAKTVWLLHQGRPIREGRGKTSKMQVIGRNSEKVPYADEIVWILQNMIAQRPQPFIYPIPPLGESVPDALMYWGGDEYQGPSEMSLRASDWMKEKGLPYHINIKALQHPMTLEELRHIQANGHEVSAYYYVNPEDEGKITRELFQRQSDLMYKRFGYRPGSTIFMNCLWEGGAEMARWMAEAGGTADNTFFGAHVPLDDPFVNGPFFGFGFGTAFPFYFYDDFRMGNERINLMEQPIVWYEMGHRGSIPPYNDRETRATDEVHLPIDTAAKHHLVMNMFYHPVYLVNHAPCREAIEEVLRYIGERGYKVMHMTNNQVADWWAARTRSRIDNVAADDDRVRFRSVCDHPGGMVARLAITGKEPVAVTGSGGALPFQTREEFGSTWLSIVLPAGEEAVDVRLRALPPREEAPMLQPSGFTVPPRGKR
ncbi:MAG: hypothetical protein HY321_01230 [Armatimonadetes bacterium]|nr:hypothetical protein [Armatimonadota bacterium]